MMPRCLRLLAVLSCLGFLMALAGLGSTSSAGGVTNRTGACGPVQRQALFVDTAAGVLYAIKVPSGAVVWQTTLPGAPYYLHSVTVPACGRTGDVIVAGSNSAGSTRLIPFSTATGRLGRPIEVGLGGQVVVSANGRTAYVANSGDLRGTGLPGGTTITPVDLAAGRALRPFTLPGQPGGIALIDHGTKLLVSLMDRGAVVSVSTRTGKVGPLIKFPQPVSSYVKTGGPYVNTGGPLVVDPRYDVAFVGNLGQDLTFPAPIVNVVDLRTMVAEQPISLGFQTDYTEDLAQSATGSLVFVAGPRGVAALAVRARAIGPYAQNTTSALGLAIGSSKQTVYVATGTGNAVISLPYSGSPVSDVTTFGSQIEGLAIGVS